MIRITSQKARLNIQTTKARLDYVSSKGKLEMQTVKARMEVSKGLPQIVIDQSIPFAEAGLKTLPMLMKDYADLGRQSVLEGIARRAREGDMMARPPYGRAIPQIALNSLHGRADFIIKFIPQSRPEIDFINTEFEIDWETGGSDRTFSPGKTEFTYIPGGVDIYLEQYPELNFEYIDMKA